MYEVRAVDPSNRTVLCNDTSPECVLSALNCNTKYNVYVFPCNEARGCNRSCRPQTQETGKINSTFSLHSRSENFPLTLFLSLSLKAPCMPEQVTVSPSNSSSFNISWTSANKAANYTVNVIGSERSPFSCQSSMTSCQVNGLSCGSSYQVTAIASTPAGLSIPSYSVSFQTGNLRVGGVWLN